MKILFLLTQDLESPSGLGRFYPMARGISQLGHDVTLVALHSNFESLRQRQYIQDGVEIRYIAQMQVLKVNNQKFYYSPIKLLLLMVRATWAMIKAVLSTPADVIHICKPHPMNGIAGLVGKYFHRSVIFVDCDDYEAELSNFTDNFQKSIVTLFEKNIPRFANIVTTHTHFMQEKLIGWKIAEQKIRYLSNGVCLDRFPNAQPDELIELRKQLSLESKSVIAYVGTLSLVNHPVDILLKALKIIQKKIQDVSLMLVGGGEDYQLLQTMADEMGITKYVKFCGRVDPNRVYLYYKLGKVSVDPVHDDNAARGRSPLKLFESWASDVPFVTADVGERRFLLDNPPAGLLAQPGDPLSLAECILQILENPELAQDLRSLGKQRVNNYSWVHLSGNLEKYYKQAVQEARSR